MPRQKHKYHFIYKTTNLKNGKYYIGMHSTSNLNDGYLGSGERLRRSVRKHGKENFKLEILEFFKDRESLAKRERELVNEEVIKDEMCMNLKPGGTGGFNNTQHQLKCSQAAGIKHRDRMKSDPEYRKRLTKMTSESNKRRHERGEGFIYSWLGKKHSPESIQKMKESAIDRGKGHTNSQFGTRWITNGIENKKIKRTDSLPNGWEFGRN
jgi:hypothetical protein